MRKKIFSGMALCGLGVAVGAGDGEEADAPDGGTLTGADGIAATLSVGFSGGGSFLMGTTVVCFLCI